MNALHSPATEQPLDCPFLCKEKSKKHYERLAMWLGFGRDPEVWELEIIDVMFDFGDCCPLLVTLLFRLFQMGWRPCGDLLVHDGRKAS